MINMNHSNGIRHKIYTTSCVDLCSHLTTEAEFSDEAVHTIFFKLYNPLSTELTEKIGRELQSAKHETNKINI